MQHLIDYQQKLEEINKELENLPPGRLVKKKSYYYHAIDGKEIAITNDIPLIQALSRKRYLLVEKKKLEQNISALSRMNNLADLTPKALIKELPSTYQSLPIEYFYHPSVEQFLSKIYSDDIYKQDERHYFSNNNVALRSKSELIIANELEAYGIPYRYEIPLKLGTQKRYPDFIVKNPFNGNMIIWEHFGALHLEDYEKNMVNKMLLYTKHGYQPFETIIYTFEFDTKNIGRIRDLIEQVILK